MGADPRAGARNDITDVEGVAVGHHSRRGRGWLTGTTVVVPPRGTVGGVDVRGGGPGTRETDLLDPINMVTHVDAICLTGGSAYGLDAAGGVMAWLEARGRGFQIGAEPHHVVPIVPAAVVFDLGAGGDFSKRPDAEFGRRAAAAARSRRVAQGTVGAGTGAHAAALKGGIGSASAVLPSGVTVAALVVLNSGGSPVDPSTGELWGTRHGLGDEFRALRRPSRADLRAFRALPWPPQPPSATNTTLAVIATDAELSKAECGRVAGAGHDGMARAINPIHTYTDGDVVFTLATGRREVPAAPTDGFIRPAVARFTQLAPIIAAAADVVARAIVHAALAATSAGPMSSYADQLPSALRF
ncbi:MAG: P1 family peptidase [Ilumatobacteraceae bacterium]